MVFSQGNLTCLQEDVLRAFFAREDGFFLTGGAALAGFHLHHRQTEDLDLFTRDDAAYERGRAVVYDVARALGAEVTIRQDAPGFQRLVLSRREEMVVVDLVREHVQQEFSDTVVAGIRVDVPQEILVNKLTTLLSRAEERDLVDVLFLERAGFRSEDALKAAERKDGGCTPARLAWILAQITIPDDMTLPANVSSAELRAFVADLVRRLRVVAFPTTSI